METQTAPMVSIVVPNYNYARFLPDRMESIFGQTFQDFEVILLDDASTDNSLNVLEQWRDHPQVRCIVVNDRNSGSPFAQWEKGVKLARGRYVWIAEADDSAYPEFLERSVGLLEQHPEAGLSFTGSTFIDAIGRPLDETFDYWTRRQIARGFRVFPGKKYVAHNMYWACYIYNASGTVFRRTLFPTEAVSRARIMRNAGDWLIWTAIAGTSGMIEIYEKLNFMRFHGANITAEGKKNGNLLVEDFKVLRFIEQNFRVGFLRRHMRRGQFYKEVSRLPDDSPVKQVLLEQIGQEWRMPGFSFACERVAKTLLGNLREHDRL